jgi:hypothetical protein
MGDQELTARTPAEIHEMIVALKNKQAAIEALYRDCLVLQANPHLRAQQMELWEMTRTLERWDQEERAIEEQLRVLYWVTGKYPHFPLRF